MFSHCTELQSEPVENILQVNRKHTLIKRNPRAVQFNAIGAQTPFLFSKTEESLAPQMLQKHGHVSKHAHEPVACNNLKISKTEQDLSV